MSELAARWRLDAGDYVASLDVARDGRTCALGLGDGRALVLDLETGRELARMRAHAGGVLGAVLAPGAALLATCGPEPVVKVWTVAGELVRELPGGGAAWVEQVAWAPRGGRLAMAAGRGVRVWSAAGELELEAGPFASTVTALAWRTDGTGLAATCYGGVHVLPLVARAKPRHLAWKGSLISLAWSPDAKVIACGSQDASVHFWRLASGADSQMSGYPLKPKALAWDCESRLLATSGDAIVTLWDFRGKGPEGSHPIQLAGHGDACTQLAFSRRRSALASGGRDGAVLLWEPRRRDQPFGRASLAHAVTAVGWHPSRDVLVAADAGGNVGAWGVA